ncbi:zinc finger, C6HC-type containing protein [Tanacetum coccineum]
MAGSSSFDPKPVVDNQDDIFPTSDEKYAEQLQLEEALLFSSLSLNPSKANENATSSSSRPTFVTAESNQLPTRFCNICMEKKTESEMFRNTKVCGHLFCFDCIRGHVAAKIQENITTVRCPDPNCKGIIGPEACRLIVPKEVLDRWEDALCESLILGAEKFYCPFKDCSAMLVNDGGEAVTSSECPHCYRLFCAQCKVAWHSEMSCSDFQRWKKGEIDQSDAMMMGLAKNKKWKKCPRCSYYVELASGCLHIRCRLGVGMSFVMDVEKPITIINGLNVHTLKSLARYSK